MTHKKEGMQNIRVVLTM